MHIIERVANDMDVLRAQSFTVHRYFNLQTSTLPVVNLGNAETSGLVLDPRSGVSYRPGVVNGDSPQPAGTPEVHNINWGGYGAVQAKPQPMQYINDIALTPTIGKWEETFILPSQDGSAQHSAKPATSADPNLPKPSVSQLKVDTIDIEV